MPCASPMAVDVLVSRSRRPATCTFSWSSPFSRCCTWASWPANSVSAPALGPNSTCTRRISWAILASTNVRLVSMDLCSWFLLSPNRSYRPRASSNVSNRCRARIRRSDPWRMGSASWMRSRYPRSRRWLADRADSSCSISLRMPVMFTPSSVRLSRRESSSPTCALNPSTLLRLSSVWRFTSSRRIFTSASSMAGSPMFSRSDPIRPSDPSISDELDLPSSNLCLARSCIRS